MTVLTEEETDILLLAAILALRAPQSDYVLDLLHVALPEDMRWDDDITYGPTRIALLVAEAQRTGVDVPASLL